MAQISICDICKRPFETEFKLDIYKTGGGRGRKSVKISADICEGCVEIISSAVTASSTNPKLLGSKQVIAKEMAKLGAEAFNTLPSIDGRTAPPKEVEPGVFKVPSTLSNNQVRKMNHQANKDTGCKHENKTMEDSGVICRDCRQKIGE